MMIWEIFGNSALIETLARTLLHSVWQIAAVALCLFAALRLIPKANADLRYLAASAALAVCLILPAATFFKISQFSVVNGGAQIKTNEPAGKIPAERATPADEYFTGENLAKGAKNSAPNGSIAAVLQNNFNRLLPAYAPFLVAFWFFGILLFSLRLGGGFRQIHRLKTKAVGDADDIWQTRFEDLREKIGSGQKVRLLRSGLVKSPMVIGWLKPVILVPAAVFAQMDARQLETILAHELMHIKRLDYPVNFVQNFIEILFFYHPCVWWISREIRRERECACDDAVVKIFANAQITYAAALANLEDFRRTAQKNTPPMQIAADGGKLMNRIKRILEKEKTGRSLENRNSLWSASLVSMLIPALMLTVFWANAQADVNPETNWSYNSERRLAVSFVAIPPNFREDADKSFDETAGLLIEKLKKNEVPAIGFVTGSKIFKDGRVSEPNAEIVRQWRAAGLEVGIGGFEHKRFSQTEYTDYVENVEKNIRVVRPLLAERNEKLQYFSYPFLNTGKDYETKVRFERWLAENGLEFIPYTFDNQEWIYSYAYDVARKQNRPEMMRVIRQEFLAYMKKMAVHFEGYSNDLFGREIPQTLVLTPSRLVADAADELFGMFRNRGYEFVPMAEALQDEAYRRPETFTGEAGISWMERWTFAAGGNLREEPEVDRLVENAWRNRNTEDPLKAPPPVPAATPPPAPEPPPPPPAPRVPPESDTADLAPKPPRPPAPPKPARPRSPKPDRNTRPPANVPPPAPPPAPEPPPAPPAT
jgi:beta-lactamase regulating signal transducer with metallopeptidase domain